MKKVRYDIAFIGLLTKEIQRWLRIWPQSILPTLITSTLYMLIFGQIMGSRIGSVGGVAYMEFIIPGLIMLSTINNAHTNVVSSFFSARFGRWYEEMQVAPMPVWLIICGYIAGGVSRGMTNGLLVYGLSFLFVHTQPAHPLMMLPTMLLSTIIFSLTGFLNAILARKFDDTMVIVTFILTPLIYLGGVFFPITSLPSSSYWFAKINPIHYIIELFRYSILGVGIEPTLTVFAINLLFAAMLFAINCQLIKSNFMVKLR